MKQHTFVTEPCCQQVHKGQRDGLPDDRTLFVAGLPVVLANENLAELLSRYGAVERAAVHPNQVRPCASKLARAYADTHCPSCKWD